MKSKTVLTLSAIETIKKYDMLRTGDSVLIAVSGGADSIALLHFLLSISDKFSLKIGIAHLNHMIRGKEAERDEAFVGDIAKTLSLPFYLKRKDIVAYHKEKKMSLEEAGREIRYNFFDHIAETEEFNKIALAHHKDDNAELILMNLLKGTGRLGISGIPPIRNGKYIRPFINIEKKDILNYIKSKNLSFIEDSSNNDNKFLRNRIRNNLIPLLKRSYNPNITTSLTNFSSIIFEENEWIDKNIDSTFKDLVLEKSCDKLILSIEKLKNLLIAARRIIIRKSIEYIKKDLRRISFVNIEAIDKLLYNEKDYALSNLAENVIVEKKKLALIFRKKDAEIFRSDITYDYVLERLGEIFIKEAGVYIKFSASDGYRLDDSSAYFDADKISFPLTIRNFRNGDRFTPLGMTGSQKVKKFFNAKKVPLEKRKIAPIVLSDGKIIWIADFQIDDRVKIDSSTKRIIKAFLVPYSTVR